MDAGPGVWKVSFANRDLVTWKVQWDDPQCEDGMGLITTSQIISEA